MNTYKSVARPILFKFSADQAHSLGKAALRRRNLWRSFEPRLRVDDERLRVKIGELVLPNPVGLAAGLDKNAELLDSFQAFGFGYAVPGSIRGVPAPDNPRPRMARIVETESIMNCTGFPSKGAEHAARKLASFVGRKRDLKVVANVTGFTVDECAVALKAVQPYADAIEISLSCPNEKYEDPDRNFLAPNTLRRLLDALTAVKEKPYFVKIRTHHSERERENRLELVSICVEYELDGVQMPGSQIRDNPALSLGRGSLAGRSIFSYTLENLRDVYSITGDRMAVKALGGVFTAEDAYDAIAAGASTVELLTAFIYEGPRVARDINEGLLRLLEQRGVANVRDLRGSAVPH